jgi:hypothetical protein
MTSISCSGYTRARHRNFQFPVPCQTSTRNFLHFSGPLRLFLPRSLRLQATYSSEITHMQAGQCGNQMGTRFWEVVVRRARHRRRRRVLRRQRRAPRPHKRVLPRDLERQVRAPRGTLRPREPERGRGQQLGHGPLHKDWARFLLSPSIVLRLL